MGAGGRFNAGRFNAGRFAAGRFGVNGGSVGAIITGLTDGFAVTGVELTGSYPGASTAQWQSKTGAGAWTNIAGATSATFTPLIGTNVADEDLIRIVPDGDESLASAGYTVAYAAGSAPSISTQNLAVDDDVVSIDASATGANLTFSYVLTTGLGNAQINASTGEITVSDNGGAFSQGDVGTGNMEVTATDQYGRTVGPYTVPYDVSLRTQATAADALGPYSWTVDDDTVSVDAKPDFTADGNTLSYAITGLPTGLVDDTDGTWSGTPTVDGESGTITITATDEYGRTTTSTPTFTTAYRTAMVGGADLDLSFVEDSAIATTDLLANWTLNGNTPTTLVSVSPALPAGLSAAIGGGTVQLTGTPTTVAGDATYTVTVADEYGRQTADTFTLEITSVVLDITGNDSGTVTVTVDDGTFSVTISGSAYTHQNGTWGPFDTADLDSGPVNVVAAQITGNTTLGSVLTAAPGVWIWDTANNPMTEPVAGEWLADDVGTGDTDFSYTTADPGDSGKVFKYRETADDAVAGTVVQDSNTITMQVSASDLWAYSGTVITNIPNDEGFAYTGTVITSIPEAA